MIEKNEVGGKKFLECGPNKIVTPGLIWQPLQNFSILRWGKKLSSTLHFLHILLSPLFKETTFKVFLLNVLRSESSVQGEMGFFFVCFLLSTQGFLWPDKVFCTLYKMSLGRKITEIVANANDQKLKRSEKWWFPARNFAFVFWR